GRASTAMGINTIASNSGSLSIGSYNSVNSSVTGSAIDFNTANAVFVIGNGTKDVRSDAFVVYFDGNATLSGELSINSDARLKDNIQPLGSTLDKLHQIEGKTYTFLKDEEHTPKIGVLAQEVQSVFPELVSEGVDGTLSVNYQGLVPVLINAINEQEAKMSEQKVKMSEQDAKIAALEAQNEEIKEMLRALTLQQSIAVND
ncbi:MAG: tail fiber domain-containing protein, partial [Verrucomicrobia bacterium]|nr:tail fiber domain-containing protein [Verrucomicrobiota bacterium]